MLPITVERLHELLRKQEFGFRFTEEGGFPGFIIRLDGHKTHFRAFMGHKPPEAESIRFSVSWSVPADQHELILKTCNKHNGETRFAKGYAEPGGGLLDLDILCWNGMSDICFVSMLNISRAMIMSFEGEIQSALKSAD